MDKLPRKPESISLCIPVSCYVGLSLNNSLSVVSASTHSFSFDLKFVSFYCQYNTTIMISVSPKILTRGVKYMQCNDIVLLSSAEIQGRICNIHFKLRIW
jgi:hypothetical protein